MTDIDLITQLCPDTPLPGDERVARARKRLLAAMVQEVDAPEAARLAQVERISFEGKRARHGHRRSLAGALVGIVVLCIVVALAVQTPAQTRHSVSLKWQLVSDDITPSWRTVSGQDYEQGLFLACPSSTTCYAVNYQQRDPGTYGEIEVTHDGGRTWQESTLPVALFAATPLACVDADTCATLGVDAAGTSQFVETTDGGRSWDSMAGPSQLTSPIGVTALDCPTAESCIAVASDPSGPSGAALSFVTNDGGATWVDSTLPTGFVPREVLCVSEEHCLVNGFYQSPEGSSGLPSGTILYTSNDASTWDTSAVPSGLGPLSSMSCADPTNCVASFFGDDGSASEILTSTDGGQSWSVAGASGLPAAFVTAVSCPTASACWAGGIARASGGRDGSGLIAIKLGPGAEGIVASTTDGGQSWQSQQLPQGVLLVLDVSCPSDSTCYALAAQSGPKGSPASFVLLAYRS